VNENANAAARDVFSNEELDKLSKLVGEKEKVISEQAAEIQEMLMKIESSSKRITELTAEVAKANEGKQKVEFEFSETAEKCSDLQKKCTGFFYQVESLYSKQQESEEEISTLKQTNEDICTQVAKKEALMVTMKESLKVYEDDSRRENVKKDAIQQILSRVRRKTQSHMATIRHFESEIERMSKLVTHDIEKKDTKDQTSQPFVVVVADSGADVNESSTSRQAKSSPTLIECPYCSRSYPYHLIEGHVQDCMEDSLYMDD
ncbi:Hypothetical predicted protein, partial [Paramuricea clavata]